MTAVDVARSLLTGRFETVRPDALRAEPTAADVPTDSSSGVRSASTLSLPGAASPGRSRRESHWRGIARIARQAADALAYAHAQGIIHRDVKPSNLLLDAAGTVWITDFGLAKASDQRDLTHTGDILGTLRYMPPEAFGGEVDARGDVYSLGMTLFELLAFRLQPGRASAVRTFPERFRHGGPIVAGLQCRAAGRSDRGVCPDPRAGNGRTSQQQGDPGDQGPDRLRTGPASRGRAPGGRTPEDPDSLLRTINLTPRLPVPFPKAQVEPWLAYTAEAARIAPEMTFAHLEHGRSLYALGRFAEAREAYARAISLDPRPAEPHAWLALCEARLARRAECLTAAARFLRNNRTETERAVIESLQTALISDMRMAFGPEIERELDRLTNPIMPNGPDAFARRGRDEATDR